MVVGRGNSDGKDKKNRHWFRSIARNGEAVRTINKSHSYSVSGFLSWDALRPLLLAPSCSNFSPTVLAPGHAC
eukprot:scaffold25921_cov137-Cylindrotheca_fusiformis.AAC.1